MFWRLFLLNPHSLLILNFMGAGTVLVEFAIVLTVPNRVPGIVEQSISIFFDNSLERGMTGSCQAPFSSESCSE